MTPEGVGGVVTVTPPRLQSSDSGASSTTSSQSLHSLRSHPPPATTSGPVAAAWRMSWSSSSGGSLSQPHSSSRLAPTAIAEVVSDEDSPKRTAPASVKTTTGTLPSSCNSSDNIEQSSSTLRYVGYT